MADIQNIVNGCIAKDRASQHALYKYLAPKLMSVCLRYTRSRFEAEDYLQETFIRVFNNIKSYKCEAPIEAWAKRIAINVILRAFEKKNVLKGSIEIEDIQDVQFSSSHDIASELRHKELLNFINQLPEGKRVIFNLYVVEGYNHKEISQLLQISEGTSKSQLSKAKEMLVEIHKKYNKMYAEKVS